MQTQTQIYSSCGSYRYSCCDRQSLLYAIRSILAHTNANANKTTNERTRARISHTHIFSLTNKAHGISRRMYCIFAHSAHTHKRSFKCVRLFLDVRLTFVCYLAAKCRMPSICDDYQAKSVYI